MTKITPFYNVLLLCCSVMVANAGSVHVTGQWHTVYEDINGGAIPVPVTIKYHKGKYGEGGGACGFLWWVFTNDPAREWGVECK